MPFGSGRPLPVGVSARQAVLGLDRRAVVDVEVRGHCHLVRREICLEVGIRCKEASVDDVAWATVSGAVGRGDTVAACLGAEVEDDDEPPGGVAMETVGGDGDSAGAGEDAESEEGSERRRRTKGWVSMCLSISGRVRGGAGKAGTAVGPGCFRGHVGVLPETCPEEVVELVANEDGD
ncbi:hypothetical protein PMAC_002845 [Pneumocystis sp. 'macacae']|nr:hypothetical protein PMAC_002845 [Pneumocystis sp. 'macacae']